MMSDHALETVCIRSGLRAGYSFEQSCRKVHWGDDYLTALCRDVSNDWVWSTIPIPAGWGEISNCNGRLVLGYCED